MYMYASCLMINAVLKVCNIQRTPVSVNGNFNLTFPVFFSSMLIYLKPNVNKDQINCSIIRTAL